MTERDNLPVQNSLNVCKIHKQPFTMICLHTGCHFCYKLLCVKCKKEKHYQHPNRVLYLSDFYRMLSTIKLSFIQNSMSMNLANIKNKLVYVSNFRTFILQKQSMLIENARLIHGTIFRLLEEKRLIRGLVGCMNQQTQQQDTQRLNAAIQQMKRFLSYNPIQNTLKLTSQQVTTLKLQLQKIAAQTHTVISDIRQYLMKIIEIMIEDELDDQDIQLIQQQDIDQKVFNINVRKPNYIQLNEKEPKYSVEQLEEMFNLLLGQQIQKHEENMESDVLKLQEEIKFKQSIVSNIRRRSASKNISKMYSQTDYNDQVVQTLLADENDNDPSLSKERRKSYNSQNERQRNRQDQDQQQKMFVSDGQYGTKQQEDDLDLTGAKSAKSKNSNNSKHVERSNHNRNHKQNNIDNKRNLLNNNNQQSPISPKIRSITDKANTSPKQQYHNPNSHITRNSNHNINNKNPIYNDRKSPRNNKNKHHHEHIPKSNIKKVQNTKEYENHHFQNQIQKDQKLPRESIINHLNEESLLLSQDSPLKLRSHTNQQTQLVQQMADLRGQIQRLNQENQRKTHELNNIVESHLKQTEMLKQKITYLESLLKDYQPISIGQNNQSQINLHKPIKKDTIITQKSQKQNGLIPRVYSSLQKKSSPQKKDQQLNKRVSQLSLSNKKLTEQKKQLEKKLNMVQRQLRQAKQRQVLIKKQHQLVISKVAATHKQPVINNGGKQLNKMNKKQLQQMQRRCNQVENKKNQLQKKNGELLKRVEYLVKMNGELERELQQMRIKGVEGGLKQKGSITVDEKQDNQDLNKRQDPNKQEYQQKPLIERIKNPKNNNDQQYMLQIQQLRRQLLQKQQTISTLSEQNRQLSHISTEQHKVIAQLETIQNYRQQYEQLKKDNLIYEEQVKYSEQCIQQMEGNIQNMKDIINSNQKQIEEKTSAIIQKQRQLVHCQQELESIKLQNSKLSTMNKELIREKEQALLEIQQKDSQISALRRELAHLQERLAKIQIEEEQSQSIIQEKQQLAQQLNQYSKRVEQHEVRIQELQVDNVKLRQSVTQLRIQIESKEQTINNMARLNEEELQFRRKTHQQQLDKARCLLQQKQAEIKDMQGQKQATISKMTGQLERLRKQLEETKTKQTEQKITFEQDKSKLVENNLRLEQAIKELTVKIDLKQRQYGEMSCKLEQTDKLLRQTKQLTHNQQVSLKTQVQTLNEKLQSLNAQNKTLNQQLTTISNQKLSLHQQIQNLQQLNQSLNLQLTSIKKQNHKLILNQKQQQRIISNNNNQNYQSQINHLKKTILKNFQDLNHYQQKIATLNSLLEKTQQQKQLLKTNLTQAQQNNQTLLKQTNKLTQLQQNPTQQNTQTQIPLIKYQQLKSFYDIAIKKNHQLKEQINARKEEKKKIITAYDAKIKQLSQQNFILIQKVASLNSNKHPHTNEKPTKEISSISLHAKCTEIGQLIQIITADMQLLQEKVKENTVIEKVYLKQLDRKRTENRKLKQQIEEYRMKDDKSSQLLTDRFSEKCSSMKPQNDRNEYKIYITTTSGFSGSQSKVSSVSSAKIKSSTTQSKLGQKDK